MILHSDIVMYKIVSRFSIVLSIAGHLSRFLRVGLMARNLVAHRPQKFGIFSEVVYFFSEGHVVFYFLDFCISYFSIF